MSETLNFNSLNLSPSIFKAISEMGYSEPTPIQVQAIPHLLKNRDLLGIAQTGTGKTAAFALPLLQKLEMDKKPGMGKSPKALILTPTRELASQIHENIVGYSRYLSVTSTVVFGGVGKNPQIKALRSGVDILIATPGRLLDLMNEKFIDLSQIEVLILDEADRMLDMGFIRDIRRIVSFTPKSRQTLLFSATMPDTISSLSSSMLKDPVRVEVTPESTTVEKIDQQVNYVARNNKPLLLKSILKSADIASVLIFTRTKHGANRVVKYLDQENISSAAIHGNKSQGAREKALNGFRSGEIKVLIATDIAARGIDVPLVSHVINYDIPNDPESYVHRIGRTARAGREGIAISFCDQTEVKLLKSIEKLIRYTIPVDSKHPYHGIAAVAPVHISDTNKVNMNPGASSSKPRGRSRWNRGKSTKKP